jgi:hypothetical protein
VLPQVAGIGDVGTANAVAIDGVAQQVGPQISSRRKLSRFRIALIADLHHRTRSLVALAVNQEVIGIFPAQNDQVALQISQRHPPREAVIPAFPAHPPELARRYSGKIGRSQLSGAAGVRHHDLHHNRGNRILNGDGRLQA